MEPSYTFMRNTLNDNNSVIWSLNQAWDFKSINK